MERAKFQELWDRELVAVFHKRYPQRAKWQSEADELIGLWAEQLPSALEDRPEAQMRKLSRSIVKAGCDDPVVLMFCSMSEPDYESSVKLIRLARDRFPNSGYPAFAEMLLQVHLGFRTREQGEGQKAFATANNAALQMVAVKTNEVAPAWLLQYLTSEEGEWWFETHGEILCCTLDQSEQFPIWAKDTIWGLYWVKAAWKARGEGYANSVSQEAFKLFTERLDKAAARLKKAAEANPLDPRAPTAMISVVMGSADSSPTKLRFWFDKAVAAQFDCIPAYRAFLWGLEPRWGGSYPAMLTFAEQCVQTGRFDTRVPIQFYNAVQSIYDGAQGGETLFAVPRVNQKMQAMVQGYVQATNSAYDPFYIRSIGILADFKGGKFVPARQQFKINGSKLDTLAVELFHENMSSLTNYINVMGSPAGSSFLKMYQAWNGDSMEQAGIFIEKALVQATGEPETLAYLAHWNAAVKLQQKAASGKWVPFMPGADLKGWEVSGGEWKIGPDGALEVSVRQSEATIHSMARIGKGYKVRGEIEVVAKEKSVYNTGVFFQPSVQGKTMYLNFVEKDGRKRSAFDYSFDINYETGLSSAGFEGKTSFSIKINEDYLKAEFADKSENSIHFSGCGPNEKFMNGFRVQVDQGEVIVRFRNIEILQEEK